MNFYTKIFSFRTVPLITQSIMWFFARPTLFVFTKLKIIGLGNIQNIEDGAILAMNHVSDLDPILIPATLGPYSPLMPAFSVALEKSHYKRPWPLCHFYGGTVFRMLGAYSVPIGTKGDYGVLLKPHIDVLEKGGTVGIFPEGGKTRDGEIAEGKPGVAYLLWKTGRPVIPVFFHGHYMMFPRDFLTRKRKITVIYGAPITREELFINYNDSAPPTRDELKVVTKVIMSRISELKTISE